MEKKEEFSQYQTLAVQKTKHEATLGASLISSAGHCVTERRRLLFSPFFLRNPV